MSLLWGAVSLLGGYANPVFLLVLVRRSADVSTGACRIAKHFSSLRCAFSFRQRYRPLYCGWRSSREIFSLHGRSRRGESHTNQACQNRGNSHASSVLFLRCDAGLVHHSILIHGEAMFTAGAGLTCNRLVS